MNKWTIDVRKDALHGSLHRRRSELLHNVVLVHSLFLDAGQWFGIDGNYAKNSMVHCH